MNSPKIARGWAESTIGEISETVFGQSPPSASYNTEGLGLPFFQGKAEFGARHPMPIKWCNEPSREAHAGDILLSVRAPVGPTNVAATHCAIGRGLAAIRPYINARYVHHWLHISVESLRERATGSTFSAISKNVVNNHRIPIAPTNEQNRIVEKIETLFARLDKGEEALRAVQRRLQTYRQSVLKAAVTGELTRDWREAHKDPLEPASELLERILQTRREQWQGRGKYKEPTASDTAELPDLPDGWVWASVDQLAQVKGGLTKNSGRNSLPLRRPMLRVANVYQSRFELDDIHELGVSENELERVHLEPFDILVVEGNGSKDQIGRMAVWHGEIPDAVHQNHLIKIRLADKRLSDFLLIWFESFVGREHIEKVSSSTSGLYTLSLSKVKQLLVPLPPLSETTEIVSAVEEMFSRVADTSRSCLNEIEWAASLRQSILKCAFSGQLVPQEAADESADELLERIRVENAARKPVRKKKTAKA